MKTAKADKNLLVLEDMEFAFETALLEFRKKDKKVLIDEEEVPFGCEKHLADIQKTIAGLERVRDCYVSGSASRLVYSSAISRLKKLVKNLSEKTL